MTKQEALAILERNADPYLADPAELQDAAARDKDRAIFGWLQAYLTGFRDDLRAYRAAPTEVGGDLVLKAHKEYCYYIDTFREAVAETAA